MTSEAERASHAPLGVPAAVESLARAVLYEGYALYPYRPSAAKNRAEWMMGSLYPTSLAEAKGEASALAVDVLVRAPEEAVLGITLQFLDASGKNLDRRATERRFVASAGTLATRSLTFALSFEEGCAVTGTLVVDVIAVEASVFRVRVNVSNTTPIAHDLLDPLASLPQAMLAAHVILTIDRGAFVSLADPPPDLEGHARACVNVGVWPVLASGDGRVILAAPIILEDNPRIAPESPGDLFDATEIDEILTLRILTMTPEEKREARASDARVRALLDRVDAMSASELAKLHGTVRAPGRVTDMRGREIAAGDRVRLRPSGGADAMDLLLAGRTATVRRIEQDFEGRHHLSVTVDDDPGQDFGELGLPGHRFFYRPDEVELARRRVLIACIGNVFLGDDAFGPEVAKRLAGWDAGDRADVRVVDFGIRGLDLAYEITSGYDAVIFVDTIRREGSPGDLVVVEPVVGEGEGASVETHGLAPAAALRHARSLGELPPFIRVVGCVPLTFGTEDEPALELSAPVAAAVDPAVRLVDRLLAELTMTGNP